VVDLLALVEQGRSRQAVAGRCSTRCWLQAPRVRSSPRGLAQISEQAALSGVVDGSSLPIRTWRAIPGGKEALLRWFVGEVMKARGQSQPQLVTSLLQDKLNGNRAQ